MRAPSIASIDEGIAEIAQVFRTQISEHFGVELDALSDAERPLLVDGILVMTSHDSFTIHRRLLGSDDQRIRAAWVAALAAMLT